MRVTITRSMMLALGVAACATSQPPYYLSRPRCPVSTAKGSADPSAPSCIAEPQVRAYLEAAKREVYDAWTLPNGVRAGQRLRLRFRISPTGAVQCLSIDPYSTGTLAVSAISAIGRADPFPALPPDATCLSNLTIVTTFSNPVDDR